MNVSQVLKLVSGTGYTLPVGDDIHVAGAGTAGVDGDYTQTAFYYNWDTDPHWGYKYVKDNYTILKQPDVGEMTTWQWVISDDNNVLYQTASGSEPSPVGLTYDVGSGALPAPTITLL
jgi:hypothetical protein